jgi:hypothetical protein
MSHSIDDMTAAPGGRTMITTTPDEVAGPVRRLPLEARWFEGALLGGLAGVFIVNALVAWLQPRDFENLVRDSALSGLLPVRPGRWLAWAIGVNDLVLGFLLVAAIRSRPIRPAVLAWSGVWLLAVTVIKVTSLDVIAS